MDDVLQEWTAALKADLAATSKSTEPSSSPSRAMPLTASPGPPLRDDPPGQVRGGAGRGRA